MCVCVCVCVYVCVLLHMHAVCDIAPAVAVGNGCSPRLLPTPKALSNYTSCATRALRWACIRNAHVTAVQSRHRLGRKPID